MHGGADGASKLGAQACIRVVVVDATQIKHKIQTPIDVENLSNHP